MGGSAHTATQNVALAQANARGEEDPVGSAGLRIPAAILAVHSTVMQDTGHVSIGATVASASADAASVEMNAGVRAIGTMVNARDQAQELERIDLKGMTNWKKPWQKKPLIPWSLILSIACEAIPIGIMACWKTRTWWR